MHKGKQIVVDGTYLGIQMKGVGRYTANTLREWGALDLPNRYSVLVRAGERLPPLPDDERFKYIPIPQYDHLRHGWWTLPRCARALKADCMWIPYESTVGSLPCPYTVVCHDVPNLISASQRAGGEQVSPGRTVLRQVDLALIERGLRGAAIVFANSDFVGSWLRTRVKIPSDRISRAPCAPGADFTSLSARVKPSAVRRALDSQSEYILVFRTGDPRENFVTVLRVFDSIARTTSLNLVVAGVRGREREEICALVRRFPWEARVRVLPFYGEDEMFKLAAAYTSARIYLDLSLHEGFGMQAIEAMACGTPVVCSNRGAIPEVVDKAALLVDPENETEIVAAIETLLTDDTLSDELRASGRARAGQFTWARTARTIVEDLQIVSAEAGSRGREPRGRSSRNYRL